MGDVGPRGIEPGGRYVAYVIKDSSSKFNVSKYYMYLTPPKVRTMSPSAAGL